MIIEWYKDTIIEEKLPDFSHTYIKEIDSINYYNCDNEYFDKVSFIEIRFILKVSNKKYILSMKFDNVTSFYFEAFGSGFNQISGFSINDLSSSGYEKDVRYYIEDYEDERIKFYCSSYEIISLVEE